jgi:hypothetical protein
MNHKSELTADVIAALDACRHDSDDHSLPEVASILADVSRERVAGYRRSIERIDRAVAGALQEVQIPSGLAERILAAVDSRSSEPGARGHERRPCDEELLAGPTETGEKVDRPGADRVAAAARRPSRRLLVAAAILSMAASLLVVLVGQGMREKLDADGLQARAKDFYEAEDHAASLSDARSSIVPVAPSTVAGRRPVRFLSRDGEAFELSSSSGRRPVKATLYRIPLKSFWGPVFSGLPTMPLLQGTSAMTVAVWTDNKDVYVMIVKGDRTAFESFFGQKFA